MILMDHPQALKLWAANHGGILVESFDLHPDGLLEDRYVLRSPADAERTMEWIRGMFGRIFETIEIRLQELGTDLYYT